MERRLSTIVAADVVGYSARMGQDEADTIRRVAALAELIAAKAAVHGGRIFSRAGDGFLSEFASPVSAVRAAYELQQELAAADMAETIGLELRIGIHLADVVVSGDDLLGDGVNIASRIETEASPGSVFVSSTVFDHVKHKAQLKFEHKGSRQLKNIAEPVSVYCVVGELGSHSFATALMESDHLAAIQGPQRQPNSVVVIPFKNINNDPEQEYFADGFTEDLITELSRFPDVFTISRNASFGLKGKSIDAREVGRTLGVQFCLEGGIRKLGDRVRINSYLVDAATGDQIWSEKHDCTYAELFDVQDELIAKIVSSVAGQIERRAEASARRKRPTDLEAYDCLMRGLELHRIGGVTRETAEQALYWFEQALEKDRNFGRAHAWRACALSTLAEWTGEDVWNDLLESGRLAVELDETDAESHRITGSLALYQRDFDRAHYHFNRALELNPNHAFIVGRMGELYNFLGDGQTALTYLQRAKRLDPFLPEYCRELEAVAHYVIGDHQNCYRVVGEFARPSRRSAAYRAAAAVHLDDTDRLRKARDALLTIDPAFDPARFVLTEYFRDKAISDQLEGDLTSAVASAALKLVG
ncbi:adenylate/guanylate cyclase domain-containing protein [Mesorhizobium sp. 10J20-29]